VIPLASLPVQKTFGVAVANGVLVVGLLKAAKQ